MLDYEGSNIVSRFLIAESSRWPSLARGRALLDRQSPAYPHSMMTGFNPDQAFSRLLEASSLLEKVHLALNEPTWQQSFNIDEMTVIVQTLKSLEAVLLEEIPENGTIYSGALTLCEM